MIHEIIPVGPLQCNCSILGDETTREAMVVDPGAEIDEILARLAKHHLTVKQIVITHAHIDHIGGAMRLREITGAPIAMHPADQMQLPMLGLQAMWVGMDAPPKVSIDQPLKDQDLLRVGGMEALVLHTPGHTEGSTCLYFPAQDRLIAGDTLFAGSVGRTDLPGGDFRKLMLSLHGQLMQLPDKVMVVPGHGPVTTIGEERELNPFIIEKQYKPKVQEG